MPIVGIVKTTKNGQYIKVTVYLLWHGEGQYSLKLLGVYSTETGAISRIKESLNLPGFKDFPDEFVISHYEVDTDCWTEGFERVTT